MQEKPSRERACGSREREMQKIRDSVLSGTSRDRVLESRERVVCQMRDSEFSCQLRERAMQVASASRPRANFASASCKVASARRAK
ncbi:hypothetical protein JCGZ_23663 [Jatropha curcas]|uniref:Uncharacterized protein n=2 Tax=Jatropha curcas TaxID=180498 RepID=A0A067L6B3_JATCU|nr:hypothetical protein JCGZ_23663 [Jatropha curcas]